MRNSKRIRTVVLLIQLANTLKIEPWFTLPAQTTDDYVR